MKMVEFFRRLFGGGRTARQEPLAQPADEAVTESAAETETEAVTESAAETEPAAEPAAGAGQEGQTLAFDDLMAVTCIGYRHIKHGTVCQDSSLCHRGDGFRLIAVSDGHGSSSFPRSDRGSRLACRAALEACEALVSAGKPEDREQAAGALCEDIVARWRAAVLANYEAQPFDEQTLEGVSEKYREHYRLGRHVEHAYGATLIAVLHAPFGVLALRCGDGECVAVDAWGRMTRPIPWNDKCDVNVTTSLCDRNAPEEFRWVWLDEVPAAIWIGTDGVDNSYSVAEELDEFYANLSVRAGDGGCSGVKGELEEFLPVLTQRCSQDDVSVAGMVDVAGLALARLNLMERLERQKALREQEQLRRRRKTLERSIQEKERALTAAGGTDQGLLEELARLREQYRQLPE